MTSPHKTIEQEAIFSGATQYQNGVSLGAMIFQAGLIRGVEMMAASDDPAKLLENLKPSVVFAKETPVDKTDDSTDITQLEQRIVQLPDGSMTNGVEWQYLTPDEIRRINDHNSALLRLTSHDKATIADLYGQCLASPRAVGGIPLIDRPRVKMLIEDGLIESQPINDGNPDSMIYWLTTRGYEIASSLHRTEMRTDS